MVGIIIGERYEIKKKLPEGNMSTVYLCKDILSNNIVALKAFNKLIGRSANVLQNKIFYREVESLESTAHPNIVKIINKGYDEKQNCFYIVLEYLKGQDLEKLFNAVINWDFEEKIKIVDQIIEAVGYLHQKNIVHRDLKPSNIIINDKDKVKIIDFGVSKIKDTFYNEFTVANFATPKYASPEQLAGKEITVQSDIYSLGKMFYEIFSGEPLNKEDPVVLEKVPEKMRFVVAGMFERDITKRYKSLFDVKKDIEKIEINNLLKENT